MSRLVILFDGAKIREIPLKRGSLTIGRKKHNQIQLKDKTASGQHAKVVTLFRSSFIQDLCSTNGTLVNGRRIKVHTLHDGDMITIGRHIIRFEAEAQQGGRNPPVSDEKNQSSLEEQDMEFIGQIADKLTGAVEDDSQESVPDANATQPSIVTQPIQVSEESEQGISKSKVQQGYLRILTGSDSGQQVALAGKLTKLGSQIGAAALIQSSEQGCVLSREDGGKVSSFPIRLNDTEIGKKSCVLQHRDILEVGGVWMEYCNSARVNP